VKSDSDELSDKTSHNSGMPCSCTLSVRNVYISMCHGYHVVHTCVINDDDDDDKYTQKA